MSRIEINGTTNFSKELITDQVIGLVKKRLVSLKDEIQKTQNDIYAYEKQGSMTSEQFVEKLNGRQLNPESIYIQWKDSVDLLNSLKEEQKMLKEII